jgi:hypothetical protein
MPGTVLRSHGVVTAEGEEFMLNLLVKLTPEQVRDLVRLCDTRILQYMSKDMAKRAYIWHSRFSLVPRISPGLSAVPGAQEDKGKV